MSRGITRKITELLSKRNMSQKELAISAGITESAISHYVNGDRVPRGVNLLKIARALGTTTDYLLSEDKVNNKKGDLEVAKTLIARNAEQMTKEEKMEFVSILLNEE